MQTDQRVIQCFLTPFSAVTRYLPVRSSSYALNPHPSLLLYVLFSDFAFTPPLRCITLYIRNPRTEHPKEN